ncbi:MAG: hemolysin family protein [Parcubacteria group bacterium]|nr:hemolysin family protein [Parcubacteria group bacterium]MCR4342716.1 hemolysin family protein [Patescibacteria group bacterium]
MEIALFILLIALSAFFSASETAFFSLHQSRVRMMQEKKRKNASIIEKLKSKPQRLLITVLIGNNVVNLFTAAYATIVATRFFGSAALGVATGGVTILILIFGEIVPKSFAYSHNERIALLFAWPVYLLYIVFFPIAFILLRLNKLLNKIFKIKPPVGITEEEIRTMARLGVENGAIDYSEHEMIENVFKFDDVSVGEIMTSKYKMDMLNGEAPVEQVAYFVSHSGFSRFPVYEDNDEDKIIGYIHVNQIMKALNSDERDRAVKDFISPVDAVSETMKIERLFRLMNKNQVHMYLAHKDGDPSEIIGLVTMEDILEQIMGEIEDETDE